MNMSGRKTMAIMLAASFASTIGGLPFNTLPILLGSMVDSLGFSVERVGLLGAVCFAGYLLGTLMAVVLIDRLNWRGCSVLDDVMAARHGAVAVVGADWLFCRTHDLPGHAYHGRNGQQRARPGLAPGH